jgi:hypothetical protein
VLPWAGLDPLAIDDGLSRYTEDCAGGGGGWARGGIGGGRAGVLSPLRRSSGINPLLVSNSSSSQCRMRCILRGATWSACAIPRETMILEGDQCE